MKLSWLIGILVVALAVSGANAVITGFTYLPDGDGGIICPTDPTTEFSGTVGGATAVGIQKERNAHLLGNVTTDNELDPTITVVQTITNDTGYAWTGLQLNIYMNKNFNLHLDSITGPANWSVIPVQTITGSFDDADGNTWTRKATVNFSSQGYDVPAGGTRSFGATFDFLGGALYTVEMVALPEPATLALVLLGSGLVFFRRRQ